MVFTVWITENPNLHIQTELDLGKLSLCENGDAFQVWTKVDFISLIQNKPRFLIQADGLDDIQHMPNKAEESLMLKHLDEERNE